MMNSKLKKVVVSVIAIFVFLHSGLITRAAAAQKMADTVFYNGKVITVDSNFRIAQAVAVRDGKIYLVGSDDEVKSRVGKDTKMINLKGRTLMPGIVDSHVHPYGVGQDRLMDVQTRDITSLQQIYDRIAAVAKKKKPGEWIMAASTWYYVKLGGPVAGRPTLEKLDAAAPNNPVWLPMGGHEGFTNTLGMKLAKITRDTPDPEGGVITKDPKTGEPTGELRDEAMAYVKRLLTMPDHMASLQSAMDYYTSLGITSVGVDGLGFYESSYEAYQTLNAQNKLTMRVSANLWTHPGMSEEYLSGMINAIAFSALEGGGLGSDMFRVTGLKTINEDTATGNPTWSRDKLARVVRLAAKKKIRIAIHSVCAMTPDMLALFQDINKEYPIEDLRWVILHQECARDDWLDINKQLGLVIEHELGMIYMSMGPEVLTKGFGGAAEKYNVLFAPVPLYLEKGIPFSLVSDGGGSNRYTNIWASVYVATNREEWPGFGEEYNISRVEGIKAITIGGAYKIGMEKKLGSIEVGKIADLAVVSDDPLTCSKEKLKDISADLTMLGGKVVYRAGIFK